MAAVLAHIEFPCLLFFKDPETYLRTVAILDLPRRIADMKTNARRMKSQILSFVNLRDQHILRLDRRARRRCQFLIKKRSPMNHCMICN